MLEGAKYESRRRSFGSLARLRFRSRLRQSGEAGMGETERRLARDPEPPVLLRLEDGPLPLALAVAVPVALAALLPLAGALAALAAGRPIAEHGLEGGGGEAGLGGAGLVSAAPNSADGRGSWRASPHTPVPDAALLPIRVCAVVETIRWSKTARDWPGKGRTQPKIELLGEAQLRVDRARPSAEETAPTPVSTRNVVNPPHPWWSTPRQEPGQILVQQLGDAALNIFDPGQSSSIPT